MSSTRETDGRRLRHRTMAEYALEQLREAIIMGELQAGTPLRLDELARSLGMSISPIREAVRQLEALGLAKHVPHQGAKVVAFDVDDLRDLFEVRLALESLAVRRAAERVTPAEVDAARGYLRELDKAREAHEVLAAMRAHTDFHFALYDACGAPWLLQMIRPAWDRTERFRPALFSAAGELQDRHREIDGRLIDTVASGDPERAAAALFEHLDLAGRFYGPELGDRGIFER
jgi:DNA-binding GntR family transcriptional regulator